MVATPSFWWTKRDWRASLLWPLAAAYGAVAAHRLRNAPREDVGLPVICVGNFTVGGSGKTPVTAALAQAAREKGRTPGILSRGHGGSASGPRLVNLAVDTADEVGDEPLLLANSAPVAVTADRAAGARLLAEAGCDLVIMDDGFQSARIRIHHAIIVVDATYALGNGCVLPAGPLRAPVDVQMRYASALLVMGEGHAAGDVVQMASAAGLPVYTGRVQPRQQLAGRRMLAFAGIGHPQKFFDTIRAAGGEVAEARAFSDHHVFSDAELDVLVADARRADLDLITTAKDAVRIGRQKFEALLPGRSVVLDIDAVFDAPETAAKIIDAALTSAAAGIKGVTF